MRRTTIAIDDEILRQLEEKAARDGLTLAEVVNDLLRRGLAEARTRPFRFHLTTVEGRLRPGVELDDAGALLDRMDGRS
jgi:hypothetical protein